MSSLRIMFFCCLLFPTFVSAKQSGGDGIVDRNWQAGPSSHDLYENCKAAIELFESGDKKGFFDSKCTTFMQGFTAGISKTISEFIPLSEHDKTADRLCKPQTRKGWSVKEQMDYLDSGLMEAYWAKKYIKSYDIYLRNQRTSGVENHQHLSEAPAVLEMLAFGMSITCN